MDMSAPENGKWNEANVVNQENTDARKIKEEPGMSSPVIKNETKLNLETHLAEAKTWLTNASGTITPMKILAGLALGALLVTATALPLATVHSEEPSKPLVSEQIVSGGITDFEEPYVNAVRAANDLGEEFYHPITGELSVGPAAPVILSRGITDFEEHYVNGG